MPKFAVIDIGTNSLKLLIAKVTAKGIPKPILEQVIITRLGRGLNQSGRLHPQGIRKSLTVIKRFLNTARQHNVGATYALATAAVREASNRTSFIRLVREETGLPDGEAGLDIKVLSQQEEARLSYLGATAGLSSRRTCRPSYRTDRQVGNNLVVDVGGGSTELSFASASGHLPLGAVKLTERFIHSDPISQADYQAMTTFILKHLKKVLTKNFIRNPVRVIGVGGTITTLAAIDLGLNTLEPKKIQGHTMSLETLSQLLDHFKTTTLREKKKIPALEPGRADIILAGTAILVNLMKLSHIPAPKAFGVCRIASGSSQAIITTSTFGLRHGWLIASSATRRGGGLR